MPRITNDKLEKVRLNFSTSANRGRVVAPYNHDWFSSAENTQYYVSVTSTALNRLPFLFFVVLISGRIYADQSENVKHWVNIPTHSLFVML